MKKYYNECSFCGEKYNEEDLSYYKNHGYICEKCFDTNKDIFDKEYEFYLKESRFSGKNSRENTKDKIKEISREYYKDCPLKKVKKSY